MHPTRWHVVLRLGFCMVLLLGLVAWLCAEERPEYRKIAPPAELELPQPGDGDVRALKQAMERLETPPPPHTDSDAIPARELLSRSFLRR